MSKIQGTEYAIMKNQQGEIWYNFGRGWKRATGQAEGPATQLLEQVRSRNKIVPDISVFKTLRPLIEINEPSPVESGKEVDSSEAAESVIAKLISFFSEFHFEPNFRFINTFAHECLSNRGTEREYVINYFELTDSPYASSISEKTKSAEFKSIINDIKSISRPSQTINRRFKLYYGSQGTGKTTIAVKESEGSCMVCHSSMLPQDLMEDFCFDDGKPGFQPSALYKAITEGTKIVLDEINLLPYDSLRFLQSILDGKETFKYKGHDVVVKEGFQIIGTMNLVVNGCTYSLPEPLVDRAEELRKFKLTAKDLIGALV